MKTKLMVALGSALLVVACAKEVQEAAPEPAYTQRARGAAGGKAEAEQLALDRIEVTGSRIKRADVESSEPGGAVLADAPMSIPAPPEPWRPRPFASCPSTAWRNWPTTCRAWAGSCCGS